jgi:ribosome recycling factor
MDDELEEAELEMDGAVEHLGKELAKYRTGRATPKLLDSVVAEAYGSSMRLNELATVKAADARLLVVTPWDKSTITAIERGIVSAGLGLNPSSDGQVIRVPVPPLTADRRRDLIRCVRGVGEDTKVRVRNIRRDINDKLKKAEKASDISEDDLRLYLASVQELTNQYVAQIDEAVTAKEAEISEV